MIELFIAFGAGLISFLSPCVLPLIPGYISFISGQSLNDLINYTLDYQLKNPDVLVVLTADHECGGVSVHDGKNSMLDIRFTSDYHSANIIPIWATGPGAEVFDAFMDNTEIGRMLIEYIKK